MFAIDELTRKLKNLVVRGDRLMVDTRHPDDWQYAGTGITASTAAVEMKAAVAGKRNYVEAVQMGSLSGTLQHEVVILSGATVIWRGAVNMQSNDSVSITFPKPLKGGVNEAISVQMAVSDPGTLYVSAQGYTA